MDYEILSPARFVTITLQKQLIGMRYESTIILCGAFCQEKCGEMYGNWGPWGKLSTTSTQTSWIWDHTTTLKQQLIAEVIYSAIQTVSSLLLLVFTCLFFWTKDALSNKIFLAHKSPMNFLKNLCFHFSRTVSSLNSSAKDTAFF